MTAGSDDAAVRGLATVAKTLGMALAGDGLQALALLADAGEPGSASGIEGLAVRGVIRLWTDDLDGAASDLHAVFSRCAHGAALRTSQAIAYLGEVEYRRGHLREAAHFAGLAVDNAADDDRYWCRPVLHALAVYPHAALADWERATHHAESLRRFLSGPGAGGRKSARMTAAMVAAEIAIVRGDYAQAVRACERARALAADIELPLEAARASLTEARSLYLRGKHGAAEQTVRAAHQQFIALGATARLELRARPACAPDCELCPLFAGLVTRWPS